MPPQRLVPVFDQEVIVSSPIAINIATGNVAFVVTEIAGANAGRHLLADLDATRDPYRRYLLRSNDAMMCRSHTLLARVSWFPAPSRPEQSGAKHLE